MSRLDSVIRRLTAQRACLEAAARLMAAIPGPVLEVGLGNGRTYDHLRQCLPDRAIYVFDRVVAAHPDCIPSPGFLLLGELTETLVEARSRIGTLAALAHADIGSGRPEADAAVAALLSEHLPVLMAPRAILLSDQPLTSPALTAEALPAGVEPGRYFFYRCRA